MKTFLILIFLATAVFADGTLPVIRTVNIEFKPGQLQQQLKLPSCVNMALLGQSIQNGKLSARLKFAKGAVTQDLTIQKREDIMDVTVKTVINNSEVVHSQVTALSEVEFLNQLRLTHASLNQVIRLNEEGHCPK